MRVKMSMRSKSYAVYVYDYDDAFVERAMRIFAKNAAWLQEIYDGKHKKIVVVRHVG
jgi:hypothetical protein